MEVFREVVGHQDDPTMRARIGALEESGAVVRLQMDRRDLGRKRLKLTGSDGREYGLALSREAEVESGSVLAVDEHRAVVVLVEDEQTLSFRARTTAAGIQLGFHAGHLHWRIRTDGDVVTVILEAPADTYRDRLARFLDDGSIEEVGSG